MGNGASELIDLVVRKALLSFMQKGITQPTWKGSPWDVQVTTADLLLFFSILNNTCSIENINEVQKQMDSKSWILQTQNGLICCVL